MKKIELGHIFTIFANLGVLAGIIFVAYEIRQSNQIAKGTTSYELSRNLMGINELYMTNPDVLDLVIELSDEDFAPKDERQREQAEAYARRILNNWIAVEDARDNGIVSEAFYSMVSEDVKAVIGKRPGIVSIYTTVASQYNLLDYELLEPIIEAIQERRSAGAESGSTN
jgi:hypothetical protein